MIYKLEVVMNTHCHFSSILLALVFLMFSAASAQFFQQGNKLVGTGSIGNAGQGISVSLSADGNTAIVGGPNDNNYVGAAWVYTRSGGVWTQQGSKLVGTGVVGGASQGSSVSISADGNTAIVGGPGDSSYGAVWVFTRSEGVWTQQGSKLVGTGAAGDAAQGYFVSISGDGNTAIVGGNNDSSGVGASWVFVRNEGVWTQQGSKLVGTDAGVEAWQGSSVSISADGNTAIVGGLGDSVFQGVHIGAAWVFTRSGNVWTQQGSKLVGTGIAGRMILQGCSVSLSADGNTAIVGGYGDDGYIGATWVFTRSAGVWTQQGSKLIGTGVAGGSAYQGCSVSLSADGNTAIIGGNRDSSFTGAAWAFIEIPNPVNVMIQSVPAGQVTIVDGVADSVVRHFVWTSGSVHQISVVDTLSGGVDTRYVWSNWSDNGTKVHQVSPVSDTTYTANFTTQYLLTMNNNVGGTVLPAPPGGWYNQGQRVTITAIPGSKYNFVQWSGTGSGSISSFNAIDSVTMNGAISETPNFNRKPITITIQAYPPGRLFVYDGTQYSTPQVRTVNPGDAHYLTIYQPTQTDVSKPLTQYVWSSWNDGGAITHTFTADTDGTYTAYFTTQYYLTMAAGPGGSVTPTSGWQDSGKIVGIQAIPNLGYTFTRWYGTGTGSYSWVGNPTTVTMGEPISDSASFHLTTLQDGLVAYYPFNGNANDESGNGNNGTPIGVTLTTDRFGNTDKAYSFNGTSNYIDLPETQSLTSFQDEITISGWVCLNSYPQQGWATSLINSGNQNDYFFGVYSDGRLYLHLYLSSCTTGLIGKGSVSLGQWAHITMTYDGTIIKLYFNGKTDTNIMKSGTIGGSPQAENIAIGAYFYNGSFTSFLNGKVDDLHVYNRALSDSEVHALYTEGGWPASSLTWHYTNTGTNHTILMDTTAHPTVNGIALDQGDFIGVFYDSLGTMACAGYQQWIGTGPISIPAFGNELTLPSKNGFSQGETFEFKIWKSGEQKEYPAFATYKQPDSLHPNTSTYTANGITQIASLMGGTMNQTLSLRKGWNMISSFIDPVSSSLDSIFGAIDSDLIILKNANGKTYIPSVPVNSIGNWNKYQGYQIKMQNPRSFSMMGNKLLPEYSPISLPGGWSMFSYLRDAGLRVDSALQSIGGHIIIVKDQDGNVYYPALSINSIGTLMPGSGYQIKLTQPDVLSYPSNSASFSGVMLPKIGASVAGHLGHYNNIIRTDDNAILIIPKTVLMGVVNPGDEIGAFDPNGTLVGASAFNDNSIAITLWGDDQSTPEKDGLSEGEKYTLKIWDMKHSQEKIISRLIFEDGNGEYVSNAIDKLAGIEEVSISGIPTETALLQNYPNPFNPSTRLQYNLHADSRIKLVIYNVLGQIVAELVNETESAGYKTVVWNAANFVSGIYYYRLEATSTSDPGKTFTQVKKMLLIK
jgi:hypothetical protein